MHRFIALDELRKRMRESSFDINGFDLYGHCPGGTATPVNVLSFSMAQQPPVGQGLLTVEASRSHPVTPHSVGLLWTSDQPDAETSTWQHTTLTKDSHPRPTEGFEPAISASERQQTHPLDRAANGIGRSSKRVPKGYKSVTSVPYKHTIGVKAMQLSRTQYLIRFYVWTDRGKIQIPSKSVNPQRHYYAWGDSQTAGHSLLRNTHENEAGMGPLMSFPFVTKGFSKRHSPPQLQ